MVKTSSKHLPFTVCCRRQFPATPSIGSTPTIPAWQLASDDDKRNLPIGMLSNDILHQNNNRGGTSLSSSPEIISVEEIPSSNPNMNLNLTSRDSSESSEAGSAEIVEMGTGASGEDTD